MSHALPASLRTIGESVRRASPVALYASRPHLLSGLDCGMTSSPTKARFLRLAHEPEDAKMTGVTRSLNRRLLALNLGGSLAGKGAS